MHVTRINEARQYEATKHHGMHCLRLQGKEAGPSTQMWMGMSQILPGGYNEMDASLCEKLYIVLEGSVVVMTEGEGGAVHEESLAAWDSCRFAPGEARKIVNRGHLPAAVLLVMANSPPGTPGG